LLEIIIRPATVDTINVLGVIWLLAKYMHKQAAAMANAEIPINPPQMILGS
jgi:hypothetical protein